MMERWVGVGVQALAAVLMVVVMGVAVLPLLLQLVVVVGPPLVARVIGCLVILMSGELAWRVFGWVTRAELYLRSVLSGAGRAAIFVRGIRRSRSDRKVTGSRHTTEGCQWTNARRVAGRQWPVRASGRAVLLLGMPERARLRGRCSAVWPTTVGGVMLAWLMACLVTMRVGRCRDVEEGEVVGEVGEVGDEAARA